MAVLRKKVFQPPPGKHSHFFKPSTKHLEELPKPPSLHALPCLTPRTPWTGYSRCWGGAGAGAAAAAAPGWTAAVSSPRAGPSAAPSRTCARSLGARRAGQINAFAPPGARGPEAFFHLSASQSPVSSWGRTGGSYSPRWHRGWAPRSCLGGIGEHGLTPSQKEPGRDGSPRHSGSLSAELVIE